MSGITDINELLSSMQPALVDELFVFCTVKGELAEAVGLTAAVSTKLTSKGISANVIAAYYHDHIFVSNDKAEQALSALKELSNI